MKCCISNLMSDQQVLLIKFINFGCIFFLCYNKFEDIRDNFWIIYYI